MKIESLWCFHQASYVYKCPMLHLFLIFGFNMYILIFINFMSKGKYILKNFHIYFAYIYIFIYFLVINCTFLVNISIFSNFHIQSQDNIYNIYYVFIKDFFSLFWFVHFEFCKLDFKDHFHFQGRWEFQDRTKMNS